MIFADTFYWYGLCNSRDQWHKNVLLIQEAITNQIIITTEEVLIEFASAMANDAYLRRIAQQLIDSLLSNPDVAVFPQSHESFLAGYSLYSARPDKGYSLVDCISMERCRSLGITKILSKDHHFTQEGFTTLITR